MKKDRVLVGLVLALGAVSSAACGADVAVPAHGSGATSGAGGGGGSGQGGGAGQGGSGGTGGAGAGCAGCTGDFVWAKRFGDTQDDEATSVAVSQGGNILLSGTYQGAPDFGGGPFPAVPVGAFLVALDPAGSQLWSRVFTTPPEPDVAWDLQGNALVAGSVDLPTIADWLPDVPFPDPHGLFVLKLDPKGELSWVTWIPVPVVGSSPTISADPAGQVFVSSGFKGVAVVEGQTLTSAGDFDGLVLKLDSGGKLVWVKTFGGAGADRVHHLATTPEGSVIVSGETTTAPMSLSLRKFDAGGATLWSKTFPAQGDGSSYSRGLAVSPSGEIAWTERFQGTLDLGGGPLVADATKEGSFLARFEPGGGHLASQLFPVGSTDVAFDGAGHLLFSGQYLGAAGSVDLGGGPLPPTAGAMMFAAKFDAFGKHLWSHGFPSKYGFVSLVLSNDPTGAAVLAGGFESPIDFGDGPLVPAGVPNDFRKDVFVAKLAP